MFILAWVVSDLFFLRRFHLILFYLVISSQSLSLSMSGSSGSTRASRRSPGAPTRAPRSPIRGAANSGSIRPSNNVFGALAEDGKDSGDAGESSTSFPASSPFFSGWFSKHLADGKLSDLPFEPLVPYLPENDDSLLREALGFQCFVDSGRPVTDTAFTTQMESVLSKLRHRQDFDVNLFQAIPVPEEGINAQHIINIFALFDKILIGTSDACGLNAAAICKASPDLLVQSAVGSSDLLGIGCIFTDPRHMPNADQFSQSRFYGSSTMPMTALKQAHGSGPFYRHPSKFDADRHAQVLAFNESQFDFSKHYYSRDVLYSFRVFSEVQRLFFTFLQRFADFAKMQGRSWATVYAAQLEELGKSYTENTLVDLSVLPTFAYLAMKSLSCDFSRGALAFQLLLTHFSALPLMSHHSDIAYLYSLRLDGDRHILEELTTYQKKWELIRDSSVNPGDPFTPHPAVDEFLAVSVFLCALRDLITRASVTQERAANLMTVRQLSKTCEPFRTCAAIRVEIAKIPVAELGPLFPVRGLAAHT